MEYTTLGRTGLRVSVAGLGCGGFSRLGLSTGGSPADAVKLVRIAIDSGINLIDTAAQYGTEPMVGEAMRDVPRASVVIATKCLLAEKDVQITADGLTASLDASLKALGTDYVDIFQLHGVSMPQYEFAMAELMPALERAKAAGKFRYLGITESGSRDPDHAVLLRAAADGMWDVGMVAFNMLHRTASDRLFPLAIEGGMATLVMHAVRSIFARPEFLAASIRDLAASGKVPAELLDAARPLDFLVHPAGAESVTDAAYRFARHTPGVSVVLFGTGSAEHLRANVASICRPPLPAEDTARLLSLFGQVSGLGLENPGG